jgi:hypothetical protein
MQTMGLGAEAKLAARAGLSARIDRLACELAHMKPNALAFAVDDIRRIARDNDLPAVADLARGLENAIAESRGTMVVLPFLDAMSDAVGCDSLDPAATQSLLASVGLRLHG